MGKIRVLFINFSFRSFANLLSKIFGIITLPIISRALGPESYGNFNLINLIAQYTFLPISLLGLRIYGIREIASERKEDRYAINILSMQLSIACLAVSVSFLITYLIFRLSTIVFISIIIGYLIVFSESLNLEFFFVAKKNLIFPTIARFSGQIFYVIGVFLLIRKPNDLPVLILLTSMTIVISDLIQLRKFHLNHAKINIRLCFKDAFNLFRQTYKLGISTNLEVLIPSIPQILIPVILGQYALGIFSGGYKIYTVLIMFYITLFYALAPYLVKLNNYASKVRKRYHIIIFAVIISLSTTIGLFLYIFGESIIIILLGESFQESVTILKALSLTLIPFAPIMMLLGNILVYSGAEKYYLYTLIISGIVILISSPLFLFKYGLLGAVFAMALSLFVNICVMFYYYVKEEEKLTNYSKYASE